MSITQPECVFVALVIHHANELIGSADVVRFIKSRRMAWLGHVMRMDGGRMP